MFYGKRVKKLEAQVSNLKGGHHRATGATLSTRATRPVS